MVMLRQLKDSVKVREKVGLLLKRQTWWVWDGMMGCIIKFPPSKSEPLHLQLQLTSTYTVLPAYIKGRAHLAFKLNLRTGQKITRR